MDKLPEEFNRLSDYDLDVANLLKGFPKIAEHCAFYMRGHFDKKNKKTTSITCYCATDPDTFNNTLACVCYQHPFFKQSLLQVAFSLILNDEKTKELMLDKIAEQGFAKLKTKSE